MGLIRHRIREAIRLVRGGPPITAGVFDLATLPALLGKSDPLILEIGCNDGGQTRDFLTLFPASTVYAFEPDPRARERFKAAVQDRRVTLFDLAISDTDGEIDFHMSNGAPSEAVAAQLPDGWDLSGSIRKPTRHLDSLPWCTFDQTIKVKTLRLDSWCQRHGIGAIDFIWADVQGAEADLIRGGAAALARTRYFYTEYSDRELYEGQLGLTSLLLQLPDFEVVHRFDDDVLLRNTRL